MYAQQLCGGGSYWSSCISRVCMHLKSCVIQDIGQWLCIHKGIRSPLGPKSLGNMVPRGRTEFPGCTKPINQTQFPRECSRTVFPASCSGTCTCIFVYVPYGCPAIDWLCNRTTGRSVMVTCACTNKVHVQP